MLTPRLPEAEVRDGRKKEVMESTFITGFQRMQNHVHAIARRSGFWEDAEDRNPAECIALIHSEVSEALEAIRKDPDAPDKHCPDLRNLEVEFADVIIRIMDFAEVYGLKVGEAVIAKSAANEQRPYKHGKAF